MQQHFPEVRVLPRGERESPALPASLRHSSHQPCCPPTRCRITAPSSQSLGNSIKMAQKNRNRADTGSMDDSLLYSLFNMVPLLYFSLSPHYFWPCSLQKHTLTRTFPPAQRQLSFLQAGGTKVDTRRGLSASISSCPMPGTRTRSLWAQTVYTLS